MSWHYSQALAAASSAAGFSDGVQFALSSLTNTLERSSSLDRTTGALSRSQSGTTFGHSTASRGEASSTSSPVASRVRTSASREKETASTGSGLDCGERWLASFARFDRDSRSWKTHQLSLVEDSASFSETWPRSGTMRNGESWERPTLALLIGGSESGSLLTWATPTVKGNYNRRGASAASGDGLATQVKARVMLPTPTCQDAANNGGPSQHRRATTPLNAVVGGALNPVWVEWLMGWPLKWTALDASGMGRYLKRRRRRSSRLQQGEDGQHE